MNATRTQTRLLTYRTPIRPLQHIGKVPCWAEIGKTFFKGRESLARRNRSQRRAFDAFIVMKASTSDKMEKGTEGSGLYEVDAKCRDGQYDVKLDKDFKVIVMTRD